MIGTYSKAHAHARTFAKKVVALFVAVGYEPCMTVGQGLKDWRERHGLSREHLAARAGCTARTIENWETDKSAPSVVELALMVPLAPGLLEAVGLKKRAS